MRNKFRVLTLISTFVVTVALAMPAAAQQPTAPAAAQPEPQPTELEPSGFKFGIGGALVRSTIKFDGSKNSVSSALGTLGGIWLAGHGEGRLGVVIEGTYAIRGADDRIGEGSLRVHYVQAPLLVRFDLKPRVVGRPHFYAIGGGAALIRIKARLNGEPANDEFKRFDVGIIGGAGIEVWRLSFEGRGHWGVYGISKADTGILETRHFGIELLLKLRLK